MTTYLITGANGQVGSQLVRQLQARPDATVIAADRDTLDITDRAAVFQAAQTHRPHIIINAAAHTAVDKAESVYGQTKLDGDTAALAACPRTIVLRTAWVFGEHGGNFVKTMLRLGRERDTLGIVADQHGAPTYAGDIAAALIQIARHIAAGQPVEYGVYHFSGSPYTSWHGFAGEIFRRAAEQNLLPRIPTLNAIATTDYPTPAKRPANSRLDCSKIQAAFGIAPSDWQAALGSLKDYVG